MKRYIIIVNGSRRSEVEATTAEMAYRAVMCWYRLDARITVQDAETGETIIFSSRHDESGNLLEVIAEPQPREPLAVFLAALEGVTVEIHGEKTDAPVLWVFGDTRQHAATLKAAGLRWSPKKSGWYCKYIAA